jgi:hypothetical protein
LKTGPTGASDRLGLCSVNSTQGPIFIRDAGHRFMYLNPAFGGAAMPHEQSPIALLIIVVAAVVAITIGYPL